MLHSYMIFWLAATITTAPFDAVVIGAQDGGSTIRVSTYGNAIMDDLYYKLPGVMAPKDGQKRSNDATRFLLDLALGEEVSIEVVPLAKDDVLARVEAYERPARAARIRMGNVWLHEALVDAGMAWVTPTGRRDAKLVKLEDGAKAAKRGVWQDPDPMPPWLWHDLTLLVETDTKRVHTGWDCPWIRKTQCKPSCDRAYSLDGLTPHEECFDDEKLRIARAFETGHHRGGKPMLPKAARRTCSVDADCGFAPPTPCTCTGCGQVWRTPVRKDVAARMAKNYDRGHCAPVGCPACASFDAGKKAVCKESQCQVE